LTRAFRVATDVAKRVPVFRRTGRGWMCVGLGVTAAAAYVVAGSPAIMQATASNQILGVGALIVGLAARGESDHAEHVAGNEQSGSPPPTRDR